MSSEAHQAATSSRGGQQRSASGQAEGSSPLLPKPGAHRPHPSSNPGLADNPDLAVLLWRDSACDTRTAVSWNMQGSMWADRVPTASGMLESQAFAGCLLKAEGTILGLFQETGRQDAQGMVRVENPWRHHGYHAFLRNHTEAASGAAERGCL